MSSCFAGRSDPDVRAEITLQRGLDPREGRSTRRALDKAIVDRVLRRWWEF